MTIRHQVPAARGRMLFIEDNDAGGPVTVTITDDGQQLAATISRDNAATLGGMLATLYGTGWTSDKLALSDATLRRIQAGATRARLLRGGEVPGAEELADDLDQVAALAAAASQALREQLAERT